MGALVVAILGLLLWSLVLVFFRVHRIWLPFYILGAVGLAVAIIYFGRSVLPVELLLKLSIGATVHEIGQFVGVETKLFQGVPGALLVLVIGQPIGWTLIQVDIECSGLLESAVLVGLLAFYPGWNRRTKIFYAGVGLAGTYIANIARLMLIVSVLHWGGKDSLFIAHTIIGRALFFGIIIGVYWFTITRPTIIMIGNSLERDAR